MKEIIMENTKMKGSVETSKAASKTCKRLFPVWCKPPTQGELQNIIIGLGTTARDEQILAAGNWWLWARNLMIENVFSKEEKTAMMGMDVNSAQGRGKIHFVTARSPELLHAKIGKGDPKLPRSLQALTKLFDIVSTSESFLPTEASLIFADLAIDNLPEVEKVCNVNETIDANIHELENLAEKIGFKKLNIFKMSKLKSQLGTLENLVDKSGLPKFIPVLSEKSKTLINTAIRESAESQKRAFGWNDQQICAHNLNIAITMGLVGQAVKLSIPSAILIHNEAFIARGQLNNIFNHPKDPLPVISLRDLLESKRTKE